MALSVNELGQAPAAEPQAPSIYSDSYKHPIVDSVYQNENSMLSLIKGRPFITEYYRNVVRDGTTQHAYQPGSGVYQQFTRIHKVVMKEQDDGFSFDPKMGTAEKTYRSYVIYGLAPAIGDVFIADAGDGKAGLYYIFEPPVFSEVTANKVYTISFKLVGFVTKEIEDELSSFVIEELYYERDQQLKGGQPIVSKGEFLLKKEIWSWYPTIVHYIYERFFWADERSLAMDNKETFYYDPYLVRAFSALVSTDVQGTYPKVYQFSLEYGDNIKAQHGTLNIWDVLIRDDWNLLPICKPTAAILDVKKFYSTRMYGNIRSTHYQGVIVTNPEDYGENIPWIRWDEWVPNRGAKPMPDIPIMYILSPEFYKGDPQTPFEKLLVACLRDKIYDLHRINEYLKTFWTLTDRERLYHGTMLLLIIQKSRKLGKLL